MYRESDFHIDHFYFGNIVSDEPCSRFHRHDEFEVTYLFEGNMIRRFEENECVLAPHSLLLVPSRVEHAYRYLSRRVCNVLSVHFLPEFLDETGRALLPACFGAKPDLCKDDASGAIDCFARSFLECRDLTGAMQKAALQGRLVSLLTHAYRLRGQPPAAPRPGSRRIRALLEYLDDPAHLREPLSLRDLSRRFNVSRGHLNVLFKEETGTTLITFIRSRRLNLAREKLDAGYGAEEAAFEAGFNDYSAFFRAYKALFGAAPSSGRSPRPPRPARQGRVDRAAVSGYTGAQGVP